MNWPSCGIFVVLLLITSLMGCKQDDFQFNYSSSKTPASSVVLGAAQSAYTQNPRVNLVLNSENSYEVTYFINKPCVYKEASAWEPYTTNKDLQLPDEDGEYTISVMYRTADHFPSKCQSVKVVLDRQGPNVPRVSLRQRTSSTLATPSFSFEMAKDFLSPIKGYQARVLLASNNTVTFDWADVSAIPGALNSLTVAMASGNAYIVEVRAQDEAGNWGPAARSSTYYAGLTLDFKYLNSNGASVDCGATICTLRSGVYKMSINLSFAVPEDITINFNTVDYTGYAGLDYFAVQGTQQIPAGATSTSFLLNIHETYTPGPQRIFRVNYTSPLSPDTITRNIFLRKADEEEMTAKAVQPHFTSVSMGAYITCGISTDKQVYCWGSRALGSRSFPYGTKIPGFESDEVIQVEAGSEGGCALTAAKQVKCWYSISLRDYLVTTYSTATALPDFDDVEQIAMNQDLFGFLCGVHTNGTLRCAGYNGEAELGIGSTTAPGTSVLVSGFSNAGVDPAVKKVSVGGSFSCALTVAGEVYCWGWNDRGQTGVDTATSTVLSPVRLASLSGVTDISAGLLSACATTSDDRLWCWGDNSVNQLGQPSATGFSFTPIEIPGQTGIKSLAAGGTTNCVIRDIGGNDKLYCWGINKAGGLALPYWGIYLTPVEVPMTGPPGSIAVAKSTARGALCVVNPQNEIQCAGQSAGLYTSELGWSSAPGASFDYALPFNSYFDQSPKDLMMSGFTRCFTNAEGKAYCNGINTLNSPYMTTNGVYAVEPELLASNSVTSFAQSTLDVEFMCYVDADKYVWCRGHNSYGSLGDGSTTDSSVFKQIPGLSNIKMVVAGNWHACALSYQGEVYCWGGNGWGQLGLPAGSPSRMSTPRLITTLPADRITSIAAGQAHNCALLETGPIYCWGYNPLGQLGVGSTTNTHVPAAISSAQKFVYMSSGRSNTCAIAEGGHAYCWGYNGNGVLGDGTTVNRTVPTQVTNTGQKFSTIAVSSAGSCATTQDGEVYCWGWNGNGGLGDGSYMNSLVPVKVKNIAGGAVKVGISSLTSASSSAWYPCALIKINGSAQDIKCWGTSNVNSLVPNNVSSHLRRLWVDANSI